MARVVRKVSSKTAKGQNKKTGLLKNKLFWIIGSVVLVIGLTVGIVLGVVLNQNSEEQGNTTDYFATQEEVEFTKGSYASVLNYTNLNYENPQNNTSLFVENVFIFAYDLTSFYPDSTDEDNYNSKHADILAKLIDLQKAIDAANAKDDTLEIKLYIIDTSVGQNGGALTDTKLGGTEDSTNKFLFSYVQHGELVSDSLSIRGKKYVLQSGVLNDLITTIIPQTINYVNDGLVEQE